MPQGRGRGPIEAHVDMGILEWERNVSDSIKLRRVPSLPGGDLICTLITNACGMDPTAGHLAGDGLELAADSSSGRVIKLHICKPNNSTGLFASPGRLLPLISPVNQVPYAPLSIN